MMILASVTQPSLTDQAPTSAINAAISWVTDLFLGPLAIMMAVIAIAWIGFAMLSGRIEIRRSLTVLLGCFLLFGARGIAEGLRSAATNEGAASVASAPLSPSFVQSTQQANMVNGYDPYSTVAVTQASQ